MTDSPPLARPTQPLKEHLDGVVSNINVLLPTDIKTSSGRSLRELVATVAHLHDIGKLTPSFQQYIREQPDRAPTEDEYHANVGALLTFHALHARGYEPGEALAGFYAVHKHHGNLPNLDSYHESTWVTTKGRYTPITEKLSAIDDTVQSIADERLHKATDGHLDWSAIPVNEAEAYRDDLDRAGRAIDDEFYQLVLRIWSTLTCADKLDAAGVEISSTVNRPDAQDIEFNTDATGITAKLNQMRTRAREMVTDAIETSSSETGEVYTLTLPTGFGKTFAGLQAALTRAEHSESRVIYALPYTTVIDQVDQEVRSQFGVDPTSDQYTIHHHLADTRTVIEDERVSDGTEAMYGETWQTGLVLTTFVQLFESLAGPTNLQSIKLPALQDAVLILDEPQALPPNWWHLVTQLLSVLVNEYNATVILMTATQPRFLTEYSQDLTPTELVPDADEYFQFLRDHERVQFEIDDSVSLQTSGRSEVSPLSPEAAAERLVQDTLQAGGTTLTVNNTVASAAAVGQEIQASLSEAGNTPLSLNEAFAEYREGQTEAIMTAITGESDLRAQTTHFLDACFGDIPVDGTAIATLTAALRPCDRMVLIEAIRTILSSEQNTPFNETPLIVSSTQLVEAGVDISFDRVYRDIAPVSSLVQAAGRCNRSFSGQGGKVVIWELANADEEHPRPAEAVYTRGGDRLQPARDALRGVNNASIDRISEYAMVTEIVEDYYANRHQRNYTTTDKDSLVAAYRSARGEILRESSLIEDSSEDILVLTSATDIEFLQRYLDARVAGNYSQAKTAFADLKYLFASVPENQATEVPTSDSLIADLGYPDIEFDEVRIIDARGDDLYTLGDGLGLRQRP